MLYFIFFCLFIAVFISHETSLEWYRRTWHQIPDWNALFMIPRGFCFTKFSGGTVQCWNGFHSHYESIINKVLVKTRMLYGKNIWNILQGQAWCKYLHNADETYLGLFLPCFFRFSLSLSLSLWCLPISRLSKLFLGMSCDAVMLVPLGQPIFAAFHVLDRTHVTEPDRTTVYFHLPWATFPSDLCHLARIYFPCSFRPAQESRASFFFFITKRLR